MRGVCFNSLPQFVQPAIKSNPVPCQYHRIGCNREFTSQGKMQQHLSAEVQHHLDLAIKRIEELLGTDTCSYINMHVHYYPLYTETEMVIPKPRAVHLTHRPPPSHSPGK